MQAGQGAVHLSFIKRAFHLLRTHLGEEGGGASLLFNSIVYYMQKGGGVQKACKNLYVINGRPLAIIMIRKTGGINRVKNTQCGC